MSSVFHTVDVDLEIEIEDIIDQIPDDDLLNELTKRGISLGDNDLLRLVDAIKMGQEPCGPLLRALIADKLGIIV